ncbi:GNAT family N-acetyltransferase [uncultured Roseobacter sp.]|uniref:GNAT family N-acetyltransferase n=1 Tax=uncultured Roseobacter sp. TaxID=114847 RepID=UPI002631D7A0|nr:GNAT family N-acetyltransferase [uncultured Roseobacter sp.]
MDPLIPPAVVRVDARDADVAALLERHFQLMRSQSPPESCHVLPADALCSPEMILFAIRDNSAAVAVGALRRFGDDDVELKSMHTAAEHRGRGLARQLLRGLIAHARSEGIQFVWLETGAGPEHSAARSLYTSEGFSTCSPFGDYTADPLSIFMTRRI